MMHSWIRGAYKIMAPVCICALLALGLGLLLGAARAQAPAPLEAANLAAGPAAVPAALPGASTEGAAAQRDAAPSLAASDAAALAAAAQELARQNLAGSRRAYNAWQNQQSALAAVPPGVSPARFDPQTLQASPSVQPIVVSQADLPAPGPGSVQGLPTPNFILSPLHLNRDMGGMSSAFVVSNTNPTMANVVLNYYWANGSLAYSTNTGIAPFGHITVFMRDVFGLPNQFYGYVQIASDQPLTGKILTPAYGALGGKVMQPGGLAPLASAQVEVLRWPDNSAKYGTSTLADGSFFVGGLPPGQYNVHFSLDLPYAAEFYNQATSQPAAHVFDLSLPLQLTTTTTTILPGGQITGTVYAADGVTPLENVNVDLEQGWYGTCTDAQGKFTLRGVPYGANKVHAGGNWSWCTNSSSPYIEQYYHNAPDANQAALVMVDAGQPVVGGLTFNLEMGGVIRGRITNAQTGAGLSSIYVNAWNNQFKAGAPVDPNGYYTLTGVVAGDYVVSVDPGSVPAGLAQIYYPNALTENTAGLVHVGPAENVGGINLALPPGGSISGRLLLAENGAPLANTNVSFNVASLNGGGGTCTDANGYYTFKALPYAQYQVHAGGDRDWCQNISSPYIPQYYNHVSNPDQATLLSISDLSPNHTGIDFDLEVGSSIQGRVTDAANGQPVANVYVMALDPNNDQGKNGANSDQNGDYTINGLAPGGYHIRAEAHSLPAGFGQVYYPNTPSWPDAGLVSVASGQTVTGIDLALPPGGSISGRLVDKQTGLPVAYQSLGAGAVNLPFGVGSCSDANGYYTLPGLPYADYKVSTDGNWNWCINQPAVYPTMYYSNTYAWENAVQFQVGPGSDSYTGIDFSLVRGAYVHGTVKDEAGAPVSGLNMDAGALNPAQCSGCWSGLGNIHTDANGQYTLGPLPPDLDLFVRACPSCSGQLFYDQFYSGSLTVSTAQLFKLASDQVLNDINFTMYPGIVLTGTVTVPGGYSPGNIQIDVWPNSSFNFYAGTRTDTLGHYQIAIPPISGFYWTVAARPYGTNLGSRWASNFDLAKFPHWDFDLTLGGSFRGCVTSDGSTPIAGLWMDAYDPKMGMGASTGPDGCYQIDNLPAGSYNLRGAQLPDYLNTTYGRPDGSLWQPLELRAGETLVANLLIPPAGRIEGRVTAKNNAAGLEGVRLVAFNSREQWEAYSQVDGSYSLDLPKGQYKLLALSPDWGKFNAAYYPDNLTYATALTLTVPSAKVSIVHADLALNARGSLHGVVTDAATGQPLEGIHVVARGLSYPNPQTNAWWNGCTDSSGSYQLDGVDPGQVQIQAEGVCSKFTYAPYTHTLSLGQAGSQAFNFALTQTGLRPAAPFQVLAAERFDHSPASMIGSGQEVDDSEDVMAALFSPLAYFDETGAWRSELLAAIPSFDNGLAALQGESLVVTYTLKAGLSWSDGAPLTSADLRFTWEKLTQPSPFTNNDGTKPVFNIQSMRTPNPLTAVVTFRPRYYSQNYLLALTYLLPEHALRAYHIMDIVYGSQYANLPVGNGPYMPLRYVPGAYLDLVANPNFAGANRGLPNIKTLRFTFMADPFNDLAHRWIDVAANIQYAGSLPADYASFPLQLVQSENGGVEFMYLNTTRPQLSDPLVRQALLVALDRQDAIAGQALGTTALGAGYLPSGSPLINPSLLAAPYSLSQAASLLSAAGWVDHNSDGLRDKNGVPLRFTLAYNANNPFRTNLALKFQADLATIGVDAQLRSFPSLPDAMDLFRHNELDALSVAWIGAPRYDSEYARELTSASIPTAYNTFSGNNLGRYANPTNDSLVAALAQPQGFGALKQAYQSHQAFFAAQLPALPTQHFTRLDGARPDLVNFKPFGLAPMTWNIAEWLLPENPYDLAVFIGMAAGSPAPTAGGLITYELNVQNSGYLTVTQAMLVDNLPANTAFVRAFPAPDAGSPAAVKYWKLGALGPGQHKTVLLVAALSNTLSNGETVLTSAQVNGAEPDSRPGNNGFSFALTARTKADLSVTLSGSGQPAVGEKFDYFIDYANLGGVPVAGARLTETLPAQVTFLLAEPAPSSINGRTLVWNLPALQPLQWGGRITVRTLIDSAGTLNAQARIGAQASESSLANNTSSHNLQVSAILPPVITRPTTGVTNATPTFAGLAPAGSLVRLYNVKTGTPQLLGSTTASLGGAFSLELNLAPGAYIVVATAQKSGLTSANSNSASITVQTNLALDPDYVTITDAGVDVSNGAVRTQRRLRSFSQVSFDLRLPCTSAPTVYLDVTENGLYHAQLPAVSVDPLPGGQWQAHLDLWIGNVRNSYNVSVVWDCGSGEQRELLVYILIDPDGYVFNQSLVNAGATITDSLVTSAVITAYVKTGADWAVWPAALYGQTNPQTSDNQSTDGVPTPGYYSFLTPAGQYRITANAPGFQPYQSPVLTVITAPVHLDIGLLPVQVSQGSLFQPADLSASALQTNQPWARMGSVLTYTLMLENSGQVDASVVLTDVLPAGVVLEGDLQSFTPASYNPQTRTIRWAPVIAAQSNAKLNFRVRLLPVSSKVVILHNEFQVSGPKEVLLTLPALTSDVYLIPGMQIFMPLIHR